MNAFLEEKFREWQAVCDEPNAPDLRDTFFAGAIAAHILVKKLAEGTIQEFSTQLKRLDADLKE